MRDYIETPSTGAIINTERPPKSSLSNTFNSALDDINILKNEVSEIKKSSERVNKKCQQYLEKS